MGGHDTFSTEEGGGHLDNSMDNFLKIENYF